MRLPYILHVFLFFLFLANVNAQDTIVIDVGQIIELSESGGSNISIEWKLEESSDEDWVTFDSSIPGFVSVSTLPSNWGYKLYAPNENDFEMRITIDEEIISHYIFEVVDGSDLDTEENLELDVGSAFIRLHSFTANSGYEGITSKIEFRHVDSNNNPTSSWENIENYDNNINFCEDYDPESEDGAIEENCYYTEDDDILGVDEDFFLSYADFHIVVNNSGSFQLRVTFETNIGYLTTDTYNVTVNPEIPDADGDGIEDDDDNCPNISNSNQNDLDLDFRGDLCDNCPNTINFDQADSNNNGIGDACEISDGVDCGPGGIYNCDVNQDGNVSPLDALLVINEIGSNGSNTMCGINNQYQCDINLNGTVDPLDALTVINKLPSSN